MILKDFAKNLLAGPSRATVLARESQTNKAMTEAFRQMVMAVFDDSSLDMKATLKQIGEIMRAQEKLMRGSSPTETVQVSPDAEAFKGAESRRWAPAITNAVESLDAKTFARRILL